MKLEKLKIEGILPDIYCVSFDNNLDGALLTKIKEYAAQSAGQTYKRSGMDDSNHTKNIITGKKAEEAFYFLIKNIRKDIKITEVNYAQGVDKYDFLIYEQDKLLDVKSSSLSTKTKIYTLEEAYNKLNFMVLKDQSYKDIIVQVFYPDRNNTDTFYFITWAYVKDVIDNNDSKYIKMNGNSGNYFLLKICNGKALIEI